MGNLITASIFILLVLSSCTSQQKAPDYASLVNTGSLDSARAVINDVLAADPKDTGALTALLKLYYFKADYGKCKSAYEQLDGNPDTPYTAHLYRAFCHDRDREYDAAADVFMQAVKTNPRLVPAAQDALPAYIKNRYYLDQNSRQLNALARSAVDHALGKAPDSYNLMLLKAEALLQRYTLYGRSDDDYLAEAEKLVRRLEKIDGNRPGLLVLLARLSDKLPVADRYYRAATAADSGYSPAFCGFAEQLLKFGAPDRAGKLYDIVLAKDPNQIKAVLGKGYVSLKKGDAEGALAHFDKALTLDGESAVTWYNRGVAYGQMRKAHDAIASYRAALVRNPEMVDALYNLGRMYYLSYKYNQAKVMLDRAIALAPEFADAYIMLGNTFLKLNKRDKARAVLQAVLLKDPGNELAKTNLMKLGKQ